MNPLLIKTIEGLVLSVGAVGSGFFIYDHCRTKSIEEHFRINNITALKTDNDEDTEWKKILGDGSESESSSNQEIRNFVKRNKDNPPTEVNSVNLADLKEACKKVMKKNSIDPNLKDALRFCVKRPDRTSRTDS